MIGNAVNGGLVMSTALTALGQHLAADPTETTQHVDPVVLSAYFMTASQPGPFSVTTEVMRCGRKLSTGQVTIHQAGDDGVPVERMRAIGSFGNPRRRRAAPGEPADMPPPEQCVSADQSPPDFLANAKFLERLDLRLEPESRPAGHGCAVDARGQARLAAAARTGREPDTTLLMMALDALPPVSFDLGLFGWTPTLEFTGHIRRRPEPGWLQVVLGSQTLGGGMMEEDAAIWDFRRQPRGPVAPAVRRARAALTTVRGAAPLRSSSSTRPTRSRRTTRRASPRAGCPGASSAQGRALAAELGGAARPSGSLPSTPPTSPARSRRRRSRMPAATCRCTSTPACASATTHAQRCPLGRARAGCGVTTSTSRFPGGGQSYRQVVEATAPSSTPCGGTNDGQRCSSSPTRPTGGPAAPARGVPLEHLVDAPFDWQPGWEWTIR